MHHQRNTLRVPAQKDIRAAAIRSCEINQQPIPGRTKTAIPHETNVIPGSC